MLLLPLLIFWARRPMQFSGTLLRSMVTVIIAIAVLMPLCDERNASAADPDAARKMPLNAFRQDSPMGNGQRMVGASGETNPMRPQKMREGTLVPPTIGRFVPLGRRWMFIPDGATEKTPDLVLLDEQVPTVPKNIFRTASTGFNASSFPQTQSNPIVNALRAASTPSEIRLAMKPDSDATDGGVVKPNTNPLGLAQIVAVENLMLQRIVEAIRVDGADDRWMISGQLTEFFDENRLQVKTAERATAK